MVYSGGTTDDVPRSAGSAICSETSAGVSCGWGTGRGGEGTSCIWVPVEKEMILPGLGTLDEVDNLVLSSGASTQSWCFWDPFFWLELGCIEGHRHLMFEHFWSLPIYQSAVVTTKIS